MAFQRKVRRDGGNKYVISAFTTRKEDKYFQFGIIDNYKLVARFFAVA